MKHNIVLLADHTHVLFMQKTLGVYKVASVLRNAGFDVQVISHLHVFSVDEIKELLSSFVNDRTVFVGVSPFFYLYNGSPETIQSTNAYNNGGIKYGPKQLGSILPHGTAHNVEIKEHIKSINPKCKLVLGGPDACDADYTKIYDYVVLGYADQSIVNLAQHLIGKEALSNSYRSVYGPTIVDDRAAAGYAFTTSPMRFESNDLIMPGETLPIEISRGCVFQCKFCSYPLNGKKKNDHIKLEEILYQEFVDNYQRFGITRYMFSDDTFNDSPDKVEMIYRISQRLPFKLEYWAYIRLDLLISHPKTVAMLFDSGCKACFFGIETMHTKAGKIVGKGGDRKRYIDTLADIKKTYSDRVMLHGSFIFGLPEEDVDSMKETGRQLINGDISLDSWHIQPFSLRPSRNFVSEMDKNYDKYGYTIIKQDGHILKWSNAYTNYDECDALAKQMFEQADQQNNLKLAGLQSFYVAGLGVDFDLFCNKKMSDIDWSLITKKKEQRKLQYRKEMFNLVKKYDQ